MTWLTDQMSAQQEFVWRRCADIDLCLAGGNRWFRLSESTGDQFEAAMRILDWIGDEFGDGAAASVLRLQLSTETNAGCMVEVSLDQLDAFGLAPPPVGRYWHGDLSVYVGHVDDRDDDDVGMA